MNRSEAIEAAKGETGRHVIWLQVGNERAGYGAEVSTHSDQLYVNYKFSNPAPARLKRRVARSMEPERSETWAFPVRPHHAGP